MSVKMIPLKKEILGFQASEMFWTMRYSRKAEEVTASRCWKCKEF